MHPFTSPMVGGLAPPGTLAEPAGQDRPGDVAEALPGDALPDDLDRLLAWFIRIRWLFVGGLAATILAAAWLLRASFPLGRTVAVGGVILAYNALFLLHHRLRRPRPVPATRASRIEALLQIGLDLMALTALVHFSGGAESPFIILYVIHAIAASMLLPRRLAWLVGAAAFCMLLVVVVLEYESILPYYRPQAVHDISRLEHRSIRIALSMAFLVAMVAAMAITSTIMAGLRRRERQLLQAQQALVRKSEALQQACDRLTEKQAQLIRTEKQASLGRLVAGIAHEINNPIQFIHGNMTVLSEAFGDVLPILDERAAAWPDLRVARLDYPFFRAHVPVLLQDMADGAARIGAIVSDLKTFARRDEGKLDEAVDLGEVVRASVRLLHNHLKRVQVEVDLDPRLPRIPGSFTQLQQVAVNVLQNAHQALADRPTGRIRIRAGVEPGGEWVRLTVEDNGCGIPEHLRGRIFDPFFTTKQRSGGTGLGLAITEGIVQQHRGRIEVESQVGQGTAFHFLLPVRGGGAT
jgi:signal transduction histidine kinase